jgi:hypothetical protein
MATLDQDDLDEITEIVRGPQGGSIGATEDDQPTYTEYTFVDGTVRKDFK